MQEETKLDKLAIAEDDFVNALDFLMDCQVTLSGDELVASRKIRKLEANYWQLRLKTKPPIVVNDIAEMRKRDAEFLNKEKS